MHACPICEKAEWLTIYQIQDWDILQCKCCKFAHISPFPDPSSRADFYSKAEITYRVLKKKRGMVKLVAAYIRRFFRKIFGHKKGAIFSERLKFYLCKGDRILDIGCGSGAVLREVCNYYKCTGVEISTYLATETRKLGVEVLTGDFFNIDFKERRFDGITMVSLLEHLPNPVDSLKKCYNLLEDNGILLLKTVNHEGLNRRILGIKWSGYRPPDHMVYFGPDNLKIILYKIGFSHVIIRANIFNDSFYCEVKK